MDATWTLVAGVAAVVKSAVVAAGVSTGSADAASELLGASGATGAPPGVVLLEAVVVADASTVCGALGVACETAAGNSATGGTGTDGGTGGTG